MQAELPTPNVLEASGGVAGARSVKEEGDGPGAGGQGRSFPQAAVF